MNLRDLKYIVAVADSHHFGQAAERCFVSQPTLSGQIKKLEEELGVTLFERTKRSVETTPIGEAIVAHARQVLAQADEIRRLAESHQDPLVGPLRIGVIPTLSPYLMPLVLRPLKEEYPQTRLVLSEELALNRGLQVGDRLGRSVNERDVDIPTEMAVVGILRHDRSAEPGRQTGQGAQDADLSVGFVSSEYLESHEFYAIRPLRLLVVPAVERKAEMDRWLKESVASDATLVSTYGSVSDEMRASARGFLLLLAGAESVVAVVAAFALAALNYIFFSQRRGEFGVLCAVGRSRAWLMLRSIKETAGLVAGGWLVGALVCLAGLLYAQTNVYAPAGLSVNLRSSLPWLFTLPIPVAVLVASTSAVAQLLSRLDPVSIIERR